MSSLAVVALLAAGATGAGGEAARGKLTAGTIPLTLDTTFSAPKSVSGAIAKTDPGLLRRGDSTEVPVMIKYDLDATASYTGGVAGLRATSPAVTGKALSENPAAVAAYERHAESAARRISAAIEAAVPSVEIGETFTTVYGGVSAKVPANEIERLLEVDGVVAVQEDTLGEPSTSVTPQFLGAPAAWEALGGSEQAGAGVLVGVLDTGIWPEHPSFTDPGLPAPPGGPYPCEFGDGTDPTLGPAFSCNNKLVGAYVFLDSYLAFEGAAPGEFCNNETGECSARDAEGHGTHTASVAAGSPVESAPLFGLDRGPISGVAPGAQLIAYRVCLGGGCFESDSLAAIEQAIRDGVDVLNYSIVTGPDPYADPVELAFLDAFNAGVSVIASVGNDGPAPGTASHGGPWVTTVGASTSPRVFASMLTLAAGPAVLTRPGTTTHPTGVSAPVVLASSIPGYNAICFGPLPPGAATGKVVACERGGVDRIEKGYNVLAGGAVGMLLFNADPEDVAADNHWLPTIHVDGPSDDLVAFLTEHPDAVASFGGGVALPTRPDVMARFSSRGPVGDFIKPDVTAPGVQILAAHTPEPASVTAGPPGEEFQVMSGSSMSGPHAAGVAALVKAAHPDWTPAMIKSALTTTAVTDVVKEDGTPADPFDAGSGSIRADRALDPTLVFDETFANFVASAADPLHRVHLNLPSVSAGTMTGTLTTKRTAINVTGRNQQLEVRTEAPPGATILVSDRGPDRKGRLDGADRIRVAERGTTEIWISIVAPELEDGQYFGRIVLDPVRAGYHEVVIPVAFFRRQGDVTLTHTCAPTTFPARTGSAHCAASVTNLAGAEAEVELKVTNLDRGRGLDFENVSAPATTIRRDDGVLWRGTLSPAVAPSVDAIVPTTGPMGGYVPLETVDGSVVVPAGDDTISNMDLGAPFYFGGEPYTRIGIVSNGYVVLGGGDTSDLVYLPQSFPDPARPNNVIAPLWTDLTPETAGGAGTIRVAIVGDGENDWLSIDFAGVRNFGDTTTHSFQLWFRLAGGAAGNGPESEEVTISYGDANTDAPDPEAGGNSGAENRNGTSGVNLAPPADGTDWRVVTTPPQPGGSATIEYGVTAKSPGTYRSVAELTSNLTPGTTQVVQTLTAEKPGKPEKPPKPEKPEKPEPPKPEKPEKPEKPDPPKPEKPEKPAKPEKPGGR